MNNLIVYLGQQAVGTLHHLPHDRIVFHFDEAYLAASQPAILSQSFFDKLQQIRPYTRITQSKAPPFFANLLPEGPLRSYLAAQAGVNEQRDFNLLALLGRDLPGAVQLLAEDESPVDMVAAQQEPFAHSAMPGVLKFSLAGVQLKFSALQIATGGLTIPSLGQGGEWIVKMPSLHFPNVPENEYAMLSLAAEIGIDVPPIQLVDCQDIQGLPSMAAHLPGKALAVKRFDREAGRRVHIEDFAQVFNQYPHKKYDKVSYHNLTQMLCGVADEAAALAYFKRLIFNIMIGNGDMHLKNWSLIYRQPTQASLAPAYDFVSTHLYLPNERLALNFAGEKNMLAINRELIKQFARKSQLSADKLLNVADATVEQTMAAWQALRSFLPINQTDRKQLQTHLEAVAKNISALV